MKIICDFIHNSLFFLTILNSFNSMFHMLNRQVSKLSHSQIEVFRHKKASLCITQARLS